MSAPPDVENPPAYHETDRSAFPPHQKHNREQGYMYVPLQERTPQDEYKDSDSELGGKDTMELLPPSAPRPQAIPRIPQSQADRCMVYAVLVTFCCFAPFGIIAIIKAMDVKNRLAARDGNGAAVALKATKKWIISSVVMGIISVLTTVAILLVYISALRAYFTNMIPSQVLNGSSG